MDKALWGEIDRYYLDLIAKPDPRHQQVLAACRAAGLTPLWVAESLGRFLELLTASLAPRRVLEIGTQGGYSTAWLGQGLPPDGILISLELQPSYAELARQNLALFDFADRIEIRIGDAREIMRAMAAAGDDPFDLIFIDADKSQYAEYLELSLGLSRPGTVIIADNVVKHGCFINQQIETPSQVGITEFHQKVAGDPRLRATVLQIVHDKGHDGISYLVVNPEQDHPEF